MIRWRRPIALLLAVLVMVGPVAPALATNCSVYKTFGSSEILTASDLNNSLTQASVTNVTPQCANDYSATAAQMRTVTDPYPAGSESLATSTAGEFERLRYVIAQITGRTYWYQDPDPLTPPGDLNVGVASSRSGLVSFFHSGSAFRTAFQAGNATADAYYVWPTAAPAANRILQSTSAGVLSWIASVATLTFEGSSTTESTTTSVSDTTMNVVTLTNSLAVGTPFVVIASLRKTTGAAAVARVGLRVNSSTLFAGSTWSAGTNAADTGIAIFFVGGHDATYVRPGISLTAGGSGTVNTYALANLDIPNAAITSITMIGSVADAAVTMGVINVYVYSFATS